MISGFCFIAGDLHAFLDSTPQCWSGVPTVLQRPYLKYLKQQNKMKVKSEHWMPRESPRAVWIGSWPKYSCLELWEMSVLAPWKYSFFICISLGLKSFWPQACASGSVLHQELWKEARSCFNWFDLETMVLSSKCHLQLLASRVRKKIMLFPLCGFTQPGDAKVPWQPHEYPNPCNSKETCNNIQPGSSEASPLLLHAVNVVADGAPWLVHMWFLS